MLSNHDDHNIKFEAKRFQSSINAGRKRALFLLSKIELAAY